MAHTPALWSLLSAGAATASDAESIHKEMAFEMAIAEPDCRLDQTSAEDVSVRNLWLCT